MSENLEQASPPPIVRGEAVEVSDGVFVIPDERVPLVPNVGIVVGGHAALVIDTGIGRRSAEHVLRTVKELAAERLLYLTVTHFHPEHGFGAQVFEGEATIIYDRAQREELRRKGAGYIEMFKGLFGPHVAAELEDDRLIALDPAVVVPGHGEVTDVTLIRDVRGYLDHVRGEAGRLCAAGASSDDAVAEIERSVWARWETWDNPEWSGFAARAFYDASDSR